MCFNQPMSGAFALIGFFVGLWCWQQTHNKLLVAGVWYFVLMETLQYFQFFWLDAGCDNKVNQILTVLGFLHICFQPYFTHCLSGSFVQNEQKKAQYVTIRSLCLIMGVAMFSRYLLWTPAHKVTDACPNTDWIRGNQACTRMGNYHLAWELPLTQPTYFLPSNNIHFFMMFAPYIATGQWIPGLVLFLTGPFLSTFITDNLYEQAAIWCFFSICQVCLAVATLRFGPARKHWSKGRLEAKGVGEVEKVNGVNGTNGKAHHH